MEFLESCSKKYTIVVFTAAKDHYARAVIDRIDPERRWIKMLLSKNDCLVTKDFAVVKDLRLFRNQRVEHTLIVDNLVQSFACQLDNGVPIIPYTGGKDEELKFLAAFLDACAELEDLRRAVVTRFNLRSKIAKLGELNVTG